MKIDVQGDDATVSVVGIELVGCRGLRGGGGDMSGRWVRSGNDSLGFVVAVDTVCCGRACTRTVSLVAGLNGFCSSAVIGG